jgi:hypothetical protein
MSTLDRQVLEWAREAGKEITKTMEGWIDRNVVPEKKLFSFLYYPQIGTNPPKFKTDYDVISDRDILPTEEKFLGKASAIVFVVLVDKNGYLPTHNNRFSQPLTGDKAVDLVNNRTKRIFNDRTGIAAARNTGPYLMQRYKRDTGEVIVDLSVPIMLKGKHWGGLRFGYRPVTK